MNDEQRKAMFANKDLKTKHNTEHGLDSNQEDSGEIPPNEIYNSGQITEHKGRFFRVAESFPNSIAVDEYSKRKDDLFELKKSILFSQGYEDSKELFDVTGGGEGDTITDEKVFLEGLDGAGALDE